jgi:ribosomal protein S18 acetylase RimI-like enzyme
MCEYIEVKLNDEKNIAKLSNLASAVVKEHYDPIIGAEQNDYMIERFQSTEAIKNQIKNGHSIYIIAVDGDYVGYTAFYPKQGKLYLDKFYIKKNMRNGGFGRKALDFVKKSALDRGYKAVFLNVNKYNSGSIEIYKHFGFEIIRAEKNAIGCGYYMDDYVMELELSNC